MHSFLSSLYNRNNQTPEENVFYYYENSLLKNLVKLLKATKHVVIDEKKWEVYDEFIQRLELNSYSIYPEFLHDMTDFINNPEATHPIFAELYNNFKVTLKDSFLQKIKNDIVDIDNTIVNDLKKFLDHDNTNKSISESADFIKNASTCKNFLELNRKNVFIDDKLKEFIYSKKHIYAMLLEKEALTIYKTCLELNTIDAKIDLYTMLHEKEDCTTDKTCLYQNQTNIDAQIENIDRRIQYLDDVNREKWLIKKIVLENVREVFLKLLPDIFNPNNPVLHIISLMRHFEAILDTFKAEYPRIKKIGLRHEVLSEAFLGLSNVVYTEKLRKKDMKIDNNELDKLGFDRIITALIKALVNINIPSHREKFKKRRFKLPHKNEKIYKNLNIDELSKKLQKIITFYQYSTIKERKISIQLKIEGLEPKNIAALENARTQVSANINKQLLKLEQSKILPLEESRPKIITCDIKKKEEGSTKLFHSNSQFITNKHVFTQSKPTTNRKSKNLKKNNTTSNSIPPPLQKLSSDFSNNISKFSIWEPDPKEETVIITDITSTRAPEKPSQSKNRETNLHSKT